MTASALHVVPPTQSMPAAAILDRIAEMFSRFAVLPNKHCAPMLALWAAHTWVVEHFYVTPKLLLSSAEPESGKTRVLELLRHFTRQPEITVGGSAAALVRMIAAEPLTLLMDEVDTVFAAGGSGNEDVRQMLNSGYKRGATIPKTKGDASGGFVVERLPVFAPVALAGLAGNFPPTITTRAITVHMRKRRHNQDVESYRERKFELEAAPLRDALISWLDSIGEDFATCEPDMPPGIRDRAAEAWECLLVIADHAGDHWPGTARNACTDFVRQGRNTPLSDGTRLLTDLRDLYRACGTDRMHTSDILNHLNNLDDSPWGEYRNGRPLNARQLSSLLAAYYVAPICVEINGKNTRGYVTFPTATQRDQVGLIDAWDRYLPADTSGDDKGESR
ncbi:hypothetical protein FHS29_005016 [Saccharothrix tamanrassetensis]|uniref:DUF3631 domain-containing protein n=1 Tax=Saccharothrix tamanrassetensis TaxID=1051531 RepID=A0A841CQK0_9PSEU|nr:DUF3631 domain-containing protein [Saccharothrix tamanrassetensis]MBB5958408.1 hypothetical protein [Saccharothrix tamanrassetensis]